MGQMKKLMLEQMERGYSQMPGERYVCSACVTDRFVIEELEGSLEDEACSYCGTVPSADLVVLTAGGFLVPLSGRIYDWPPIRKRPHPIRQSP